MYNGIKPTRLWHLTGRRHFEKWLKDRLTARAPLDHQQRDKYELLKMYGLVMASAMTVFYSFGLFSPEKYLATIISPTTRDTSPRQCAKTDIPPPCAPDKKDDKKNPDNKKCSK